MDDDYGDDADFTAAVEAIERNQRTTAAPSTGAKGASTSTPKIQQPTPQALPSRSAPSTILVSPRQKGNPILNNIHSLPWEYADTPADYILGATTCALFLSLKYHRLHPEYIYTRIRALAGKYNLRVLLTMVDIANHEESLRELSKTSLVNNLTLILCWSAKEAARYLELYKSFEFASPASIKAQQATGYAEKVVEFVTVPRSINKTDAVSLVSSFGSVRAAVNARAEEIATVGGWGEKKVVRWCGSVREPFRIGRAGKRRLEDEDGERAAAKGVGKAIPVGRGPSREVSSLGADSARRTPDTERRPSKRVAEAVPLWEPGDDEEEALMLAAAEYEAETRNAPSAPASAKNPKPNEPKLAEGIEAALAKLREK